MNLSQFNCFSTTPRRLEMAKKGLSIYSSELQMPDTALGIARYFQDMNWTEPFFIMVDELGMGGLSRLLTFLATTADGKKRKVLFLRLSPTAHNMRQITADVELVLEYIDVQRMTPNLLGLVCDACTANYDLRILQYPTLYDRRHLEARLAESYCHVSRSLEQAYQEVFSEGTFRSAMQGYLLGTELDVELGGDTKSLLVREFTLMSEVMEKKFLLNGLPFSFTWANNDHLELLGKLWASQWSSIKDKIFEIRPELQLPANKDELQLLKHKIVAVFGYLYNNM